MVCEQHNCYSFLCAPLHRADGEYWETVVRTVVESRTAAMQQELLRERAARIEAERRLAEVGVMAHRISEQSQKHQREIDIVLHAGLR